MKYISDGSAMAGRQRVNPALERAGAMIRTISPNRASFGRCSACTVRSLSICDALDQADLAEFERIARHLHFAPNEVAVLGGPDRKFGAQSDRGRRASIQVAAGW